MADWVYVIAAALVLAIAAVLYRVKLVGNTVASGVLAASVLVAFLAAWFVAGRIAAWVMLPDTALFAAGTFVHWRYILPKNIRRRRD